VPLLAGSAYKNKGVQVLMDGVCDYLPSPGDMPPLVATAGSIEAVATGKKAKRKRKKGGKQLKDGSLETDADKGTVLVQHTANAPLRAFVFKVGRHQTRGVLSYFRVYSGVWGDKLPLLNSSQGTKERASKLLQLFADDAREVKSVPAGHIGAAVGLQYAMTGDTLVLAGDPSPVRLPGLNIPSPVFTAALETDTISQTAALEAALAIMTREDPSLAVRTSPDTGQLLLSGMGALHLEIACDRLKREHKVQVTLGPMMVAYRETALACGHSRTVYDRQLGEKHHWATVAVSVTPITPPDASFAGESNSSDDQDEVELCTFGVAGSDSDVLHAVLVDGASSAAPGWDEEWAGRMPQGGVATTQLTPEQSDAVNEAVDAWFARGPLLGSPLSRLHVDWVPAGCAVGPLTTPAALRAATVLALDSALGEAGCGLLEPLVLVHVTVSDRHTGRVLNDITSGRRGNILEVGAPDEANSATTAAIAAGKTTIVATVPAREMVAYATHLRSITGGEGGFSMAFSHYADVPPNLISAIRSEA
jgi:elongation factor G